MLYVCVYDISFMRLNCNIKNSCLHLKIIFFMKRVREIGVNERESSLVSYKNDKIFVKKVYSSNLSF